MHQYRYSSDDYLLTIYYQGRKLTYRLKQHSHDRDHTWYHLFANTQTRELRWDHKTKTLAEELLPSQPAAPAGFLQLLETEIRLINSPK